MSGRKQVCVCVCVCACHASWSVWACAAACMVQGDHEQKGVRHAPPCQVVVQRILSGPADVQALWQHQGAGVGVTQGCGLVKQPQPRQQHLLHTTRMCTGARVCAHTQAAVCAASRAHGPVAGSGSVARASWACQLANRPAERQRKKHACEHASKLESEQGSFQAGSTRPAVKGAGTQAAAGK